MSQGDRQRANTIAVTSSTAAQVSATSPSASFLRCSGNNPRYGTEMPHWIAAASKKQGKGVGETLALELG